MKITILCVGKIKEQYWNGAIAEYSKRLSAYCNLNIVEVPDEKTPDGASKALEEQILRKEGERILKKLDGMNVSGPDSCVAALAIDGKPYDSVSFSDWIEKLGVSGKSHIIFVIGGSLGLAPEVIRQADVRLSFSNMTFPHQLMRVILLEQVYRGFRIMNHEPYHK